MAGAVSPLRLSLLAEVEQNDRDLGVTSKLEQYKVGSARAEETISVVSLGTPCVAGATLGLGPPQWSQNGLSCPRLLCLVTSSFFATWFFLPHH